MRVVPASGGCEAQRSMVVIVIARAVTGRCNFEPRRRGPSGDRRPSVARRSSRSRSIVQNRAGTSEGAGANSTAGDANPFTGTDRRRARSAARDRASAVASAVEAVAPGAATASCGASSLDGNWMFPVDGAPSAGGGALGIGYGWSWVGIGLRAGGVGAPSTIGAPGVSTVSVTTRRIPLALEAWIDLPIRRGAFPVSRSAPTSCSGAFTPTASPTPTTRSSSSSGAEARGRVSLRDQAVYGRRRARGERRLRARRIVRARHRRGHEAADRQFFTFLPHRRATLNSPEGERWQTTSNHQ